MSEETGHAEARHPIGVVSLRTGLPQDVLRAWERRYAAVRPHRTQTGRRLYSDDDLEKLSLLKRAVESGRRISDVASLPVHDLRELVKEDTAVLAPPAVRSVVGEARAPAWYVQKALAAVENLDGAALEELLRQASVDVSAPTLRKEVLLPLLRNIGERWRAGTLRIAHEHFATAMVRSFLGNLRTARPGSGPVATIVVATPTGQRHELGALLAAAAALEVGWDAVYLGPDLPAVELAAAARRLGARAVALSMVFPPGDPRVAEELRALRDHLGEDVLVFAGGGAASSYAETLAEIGAHRMDEPHHLQAALGAL